VSYIYPVTNLAVTKAVAATLPTPTTVLSSDDARYPETLVSEGLDIRKWRTVGGAGYPAALVCLFADGASVLTNTSLWGFEPTHKRWGYIALLAAAAAGSVTLSATRSYYEQINIPTVFSHLAIVGTVSANNAGYTLTPLALKD